MHQQGPHYRQRIIPIRYVVTALSVLLAVLGLTWLMVTLSTPQVAEEATTTRLPEFERVTPEQEAMLAIQRDVAGTGIAEEYINTTTFDTTCENLYVHWGHPHHPTAVHHVAAHYYVQATREGTYTSSSAAPFEDMVRSIDTHWCRGIRGY